MDTNARRLPRSKSSQEIEGSAVFTVPARSFPGRAHNDIGAPLQHMRQGNGMHEPTIGDDDIPLGDGDAVEPLAALLIGQLDKTEAFGRKIEGAVKAPTFRRCSSPLSRLSGPSSHRQAGCAVLAPQTARRR